MGNKDEEDTNDSLLKKDDDYSLSNSDDEQSVSW